MLPAYNRGRELLVGQWAALDLSPPTALPPPQVRMHNVSKAAAATSPGRGKASSGPKTPATTSEKEASVITARRSLMGNSNASATEATTSGSSYAPTASASLSRSFGPSQGSEATSFYSMGSEATSTSKQGTLRKTLAGFQPAEDGKGRLLPQALPGTVEAVPSVGGQQLPQQEAPASTTATPPPAATAPPAVEPHTSSEAPQPASTGDKLQQDMEEGRAGDGRDASTQPAAVDGAVPLSPGRSAVRLPPLASSSKPPHGHLPPLASSSSQASAPSLPSGEDRQG